MNIKSQDIKEDGIKLGKVNLRDFCGIWSKEEADKFEKGIKKIRRIHKKHDKKRIEMLKGYFSKENASPIKSYKIQSKLKSFHKNYNKIRLYKIYQKTKTLINQKE